VNSFFQRVPFRLAYVLLATALIGAGCAQSGQMDSLPTAIPTLAIPANDTPRIFFIKPADGAEVTSPQKVAFGAENFVVEPASEGSRAGHGHLHIIVDADCIAAGLGVPNDETHLHYGKAQMEADLELAPGEHTLCLQAADGNHIALAGAGMTQVITVQVK
jgi:hypothetical protein